MRFFQQQKWLRGEHAPRNHFSFSSASSALPLQIQPGEFAILFWARCDFDEIIVFFVFNGFLIDSH
jgi:hypothetical protein